MRRQPQPTLVGRSVLPVTVDVVNGQDASGAGGPRWYVECSYVDGSRRRHGPYDWQTATRCKEVLAQAFALEWRREAERK